MLKFAFRMFRNVSSINSMKNSVQRSMRDEIEAGYPRLTPVIDEILPKTAALQLAKCADQIYMVCIDYVPLFWQYKNGPWIPTLRVLHKYPTMMPRMRVDAGGTKFVLKGANVMCPGLTSAGGQMEEVEEGEIVQILLENRGDEAAAIGQMIMDTEVIRTVNKDVCIEQLHTIGDGLWNTLDFK